MTSSAPCACLLACSLPADCCRSASQLLACPWHFPLNLQIKPLQGSLENVNGRGCNETAAGAGVRLELLSARGRWHALLHDGQRGDKHSPNPAPVESIPAPPPPPCCPQATRWPRSSTATRCSITQGSMQPASTRCGATTTMTRTSCSMAPRSLVATARPFSRGGDPGVGRGVQRRHVPAMTRRTCVN